MSKILVLDIETRPIVAYAWGLWDQNITLDKIIDNGGVICVGLKWVGDPECRLFSDWEHGHFGMLENVHQYMSEADAIVSFNGDKFDLPKLMGEFALSGLGVPPPITSIDLYKQVKKLGLISNKLAFIGPLFGLGDKIKHEGFDLWKKVIANDPVAQKNMTKYCKQDVRLTEKLYKRILPYIKNHPFMGSSKHECGACGSNHTQSRGYRRTKCYRIQRIQCQNCGSWQEGTKTKVE